MHLTFHTVMMFSVDQFLKQHWNKDTQIFLIASYDSDSTPTVFNFRAGFFVFLEVLPVLRFDFRDGLLIWEQLIGAVKHDYTVSGANLYLTVPLWGRVDLATFSGSLKSGIQRSVEVSGVNGTVALKLGLSKEVKINLDLKTKSAGPIQGDFELFKPEYVSFLSICVSDLNITYDLIAGSRNKCDAT
jgi:hypothetical protein